MAVILERTPPVTTISHSSGNVTELDRNGHYMLGVSIGSWSTIEAAKTTYPAMPQTGN